jgi:hypothetical protein
VRRFRIRHNIPVDFVALITQMLHPDPNMRPSVAQIREHPWVLNWQGDPEEAKEAVRQTMRERYKILQELMRQR